MKALIRHALKGAGYEVSSTRSRLRGLETASRSLTFDDLVRRLIYEQGSRLRFLQVGAFDGETVDPLRDYIVRHDWVGAMVEPQPAAAEALRTLYAGNSNIRLIEAALSDKAGERALYVVNSDVAWHRSMASFNRANIAKHRNVIPDIEDRISTINVPTVTFESVISADDPIDILQTIPRALTL